MLGKALPLSLYNGQTGVRKLSSYFWINTRSFVFRVPKQKGANETILP